MDDNPLRTIRSPAARVVIVDGRRTSIRLDENGWEVLRQLCLREGMSVGEFLTRIDRSRVDTSLTAAVRSAILDYFHKATMIAESKRGAALLTDAKARFGHMVVGEKEETTTQGYEWKLRFSLDCVPRLEPGGITETCEKWMALRSSSGAIPDLAAFLNLGSDNAIQFNQIDVTADDASLFRIEKLNARARYFPGRDMLGSCLREYPFSIHRYGMQQDFFDAKDNAEPVCNILTQRFGALSRTYVRVVLPFASDGRAVDHLITAVRTLVPTPTKARCF